MPLLDSSSTCGDDVAALHDYKQIAGGLHDVLQGLALASNSTVQRRDKMLDNIRDFEYMIRKLGKWYTNLS